MAPLYTNCSFSHISQYTSTYNSRAPKLPELWLEKPSSTTNSYYLILTKFKCQKHGLRGFYLGLIKRDWNEVTFKIQSCGHRNKWAAMWGTSWLAHTFFWHTSEVNTPIRCFFWASAGLQGGGRAQHPLHPLHPSPWVCWERRLEPRCCIVRPETKTDKESLACPMNGLISWGAQPVLFLRKTETTFAVPLRSVEGSRGSLALTVPRPNPASLWYWVCDTHQPLLWISHARWPKNM